MCRNLKYNPAFLHWLHLFFLCYLLTFCLKAPGCSEDLQKSESEPDIQGGRGRRRDSHREPRATFLWSLANRPHFCIRPRQGGSGNADFLLLQKWAGTSRSSPRIPCGDSNCWKTGSVTPCLITAGAAISENVACGEQTRRCLFCFLLVVLSDVSGWMCLYVSKWTVCAPEVATPNQWQTKKPHEHWDYLKILFFFYHSGLLQLVIPLQTVPAWKDQAVRELCLLEAFKMAAQIL